MTGCLRQQKDKKEFFGDTPNPGRGCASALPFGSPAVAIVIFGDTPNPGRGCASALPFGLPAVAIVIFGVTPNPGRGTASALPLVTRRQKLEEKWGSMYWANCFHWGKKVWKLW